MSIECFNCQGDADVLGAILISPDGDFVCNKKCKEEYEKKRDKFFNETIHDDKKMTQWWVEKDYK